MKFDNTAEEMFYEFLIDYELLSMVRSIEGQVVRGSRRIDMVITLINGKKVFIELDGAKHNEFETKSKDFWKDVEAQEDGIDTIRIKFSEFFRDPERLANKLEGLIDFYPRNEMKKEFFLKLKPPISSHRKTRTALDKLWADCVKAKAGFKSEMSGKTENLHAHHINGKANLRSRYELENGICLTGGEHFFIAHHAGRQEKFKSFVKTLRGEDIFERLQLLNSYSGKTDLLAVKAYLQEKLKEFSGADNLGEGSPRTNG